MNLHIHCILYRLGNTLQPAEGRSSMNNAHFIENSQLCWFDGGRGDKQSVWVYAAISPYSTKSQFSEATCLSRDACYWYMCDYVEILKRLAFSFYLVGSCTFESTSQSSILMNFMVLGRAGRWLICSITGRYAGRAIWSIAGVVVCPDSHFRWAAWRRGSHLYVTS